MIQNLSKGELRAKLREIATEPVIPRRMQEDLERGQEPPSCSIWRVLVELDQRQQLLAAAALEML